MYVILIFTIPEVAGFSTSSNMNKSKTFLKINKKIP